MGLRVREGLDRNIAGTSESDTDRQREPVVMVRNSVGVELKKHSRAGL